MRFNPDLLELVPKEQLDADFGGEYGFQFDAESYWQQVVSCVLDWPLRTSIYTELSIRGGFRRSHCGIAPDGTRIRKDESSLASASPAGESMTLALPTESGTPDGSGYVCIFT
jgi:hypothetical protein